MAEPKPTSMIDIYEASGGRVNADRTSVELPTPMKAFDIVLRVTPVGFEFSEEDGERVTFGILLDPETTYSYGFGGVQFNEHFFNEEVTLPVKQVRIKGREDA